MKLTRACVNIVYQFFVELNSENMEIFFAEILAGFYHVFMCANLETVFCDRNKKSQFHIVWVKGEKNSHFNACLYSNKSFNQIAFIPYEKKSQPALKTLYQTYPGPGYTTSPA
jgi:hypothetical protein